MKTKNQLSIMTLLVSLLIITACNKNNDFPTALDHIEDITGSYEGIYEQAEGLKNTYPAFADVIYLGGIEVEVHCYGELLDTTFTIDIYAEHDSIMLCVSGDEFEHTYGHIKGNYHMNHHGSSTTEWMHHLEDDHDTNDMHFGGFDVSHHTLDYTFLVTRNNTVETIRFNGVRK